MSDNSGGTKYRKLPGTLGVVQRALAISLPVIGIAYIIHLPEYLFHIGIYIQQYGGLFLGLAMLLAFMAVPATKSAPRHKWPWYDVILGLLSLAIGLYVAILFPQLNLNVGLITPLKIVLGVIAVICVLEGTRRVAGWTLVIIVAVFIFYARFTSLFPGFLSGRSLTWPRLFNYAYLGADALFGQVLGIIITTVLGFILFGSFLSNFGGSIFMINLAEALMGKYRGGPAKVSVIASALFGMLSGSPVGNVSSTGVITIPLMKKTGYRPYFAGAVESSSSTGGVLMPPVMGAAAFLMAQFLGVKYVEVMMAALIPAILYYVGVLIQVDLRAAKRGLKGLDSEQVPDLWSVLRQGWPFLVPVAVLVYTLLVLYLPPQLSAIYSAASLVVVVLFTKERRAVLGNIWKALEGTGWSMLDITVIGGAVGLVVGLVAVTGLGFSLPQALIGLSGDSLIVLLLITAAVSIILGMGVNMVAAYALLAVIAAPALEQMGVGSMAAHMFVLYFGAMSFITPPVALAAITAASIAGAPMMQTAFQAVKLSIAAYLIPFVFIYHQPLLWSGTWGEIITSAVICAVGVIAIAIAMEGYLFGEIGWLKRGICGIAGVLSIFPEIITTIIGVLLIVVVVIWNYLERKAAAQLPEGIHDRFS